ncbi:MAG: addiction module protein [Aureliella sp.]
MSTNYRDLLALPPSEQLRIVEMLWDHLGESTTPIPLPEWIDREGKRRRDEMIQDPSFGKSHEATWQEIERRRG